MAAINFDQPSTGNVNSSQDALAIKNNGSGNALTGVSEGADGLVGSTAAPGYVRLVAQSRRANGRRTT